MARFECQPPWLFLIAFPHFLMACTSECTKNTGRWFTVCNCLGIIYLINKQVKLGFYALLQTHGGLMACLPSTVTWLNYCFWSQYAYCVSAVLWWQLWNSMFFFVILLQVTILGGSSGFDSADFTPTWWLWLVKPDCTNVCIFHSFLVHVVEMGVEDLDCTLDHKLFPCCYGTNTINLNHLILFTMLL